MKNGMETTPAVATNSRNMAFTPMDVEEALAAEPAEKTCARK